MVTWYFIININYSLFKSILILAPFFASVLKNITVNITIAILDEKPFNNRLGGEERKEEEWEGRDAKEEKRKQK